MITSGNIDKLEIYQGLGITEVWFWERGQFFLHYLRGDKYEPLFRSKLLPDLDISLLTDCVRPSEQFDAVMDFRDALRNPNNSSDS